MFTRNQQQTVIKEGPLVLRRSVWGCFVLLVIALVNVGCAEWAVLAATAIKGFTEYKQLHEAFVNDIKRTYQPTDAAYVEAQRSYLAARTRYSSYLQAVRVAVESGERNPDLTQLAADVQSASAEFLRSASRSMRQSSDTRDLPVDAASRLPSNLQMQIAQVPGQFREEVARAIREQAQWRSWDEI